MLSGTYGSSYTTVKPEGNNAKSRLKSSGMGDMSIIKRKKVHILLDLSSTLSRTISILI